MMCSKRNVLLGLVVVVAASPTLLADYGNEWYPSWMDDAAGFTWQGWGLHAVNSNEPAQPLAADNFVSNGYGTPTSSWETDLPYFCWSAVPMGTHPNWVDEAWGGMAQMAGSAPYELTIEVPTGSIDDDLKVWIQYEWYGYGVVTDSILTAGAEVLYTGTEQIGVSGSENPWYRTNVLYGFDGNPEHITLQLSADGFAPMVDSFSVATAVPEPGTMGLLGLGFAAFAGAAGRRPRTRNR